MHKLHTSAALALPALALPVLALLALVAACAPVVVAPPTIPPPGPGLERITGQPTTAAIGLLGAPTLERTELPGRMLQFARGACVLDVYYYPPTTGAVPVARYAEARRPDGKPMDAGACVAEIVPVAAAVAPEVPVPKPKGKAK